MAVDSEDEVSSGFPFVRGGSFVEPWRKSRFINWKKAKSALAVDDGPPAVERTEVDETRAIVDDSGRFLETLAVDDGPPAVERPEIDGTGAVIGVSKGRSSVALVVFGPQLYRLFRSWGSIPGMIQWLKVTHTRADRFPWPWRPVLLVQADQ